MGAERGLPMGPGTGWTVPGRAWRMGVAEHSAARRGELLFGV